VARLLGALDGVAERLGEIYERLAAGVDPHGVKSASQAGCGPPHRRPDFRGPGPAGRLRSRDQIAPGGLPCPSMC
jgi:hypothetical protein